MIRRAAALMHMPRHTRCRRTAPYAFPPHRVLPRPPCLIIRCGAPCATSTQEGKLPLHHAAAKGAPLDVMRLLLDTNPEAASALAQARR